MKIVEQHQHQLEIIDHNHQCLWGLLFATPFLCIALGLLVGTVKMAILDCQRPTPQQVTCQHQVVGILGTEQKQLPGTLSNATVIKNNGIGVVLWMTTTQMELASYRTFVHDQHFQTADRINAFLADPQQTQWRVEQDDRLSNFVWLANFLIGGLVIAAVSLSIPKEVFCRLDQRNCQVILSKKYWLFGKRQILVPLSAVERLRINELPYLINHQATYTLQLVMTSGRKISLSVPSRDLSEYQTIVDRTNHFLQQVQGQSST